MNRSQINSISWLDYLDDQNNEMICYALIRSLHTIGPTIFTWKVAEILEKTFTNTRNESHTIKYKVFAA